MEKSRAPRKRRYISAKAIVQSDFERPDRDSGECDQNPPANPDLLIPSLNPELIPDVIPARIRYSRARNALAAGRFGIVFSGTIRDAHLPGDKSAKINFDSRRNSGSSPGNFTKVRIAIKIIGVKRKGNNRELSLLRRLRHPNVIRLLCYHYETHEIEVDEDDEDADDGESGGFLALHLIFEAMASTIYDRLEAKGPFEVAEIMHLSKQLFEVSIFTSFALKLEVRCP